MKNLHNKIFFFFFWSQNRYVEKLLFFSLFSNNVLPEEPYFFPFLWTVPKLGWRECNGSWIGNSQSYCFVQFQESLEEFSEEFWRWWRRRKSTKKFNFELLIRKKRNKWLQLFVVIIPLSWILFFKSSLFYWNFCFFCWAKFSVLFSKKFLCCFCFTDKKLFRQRKNFPDTRFFFCCVFPLEFLFIRFSK